MNLVNYKDAYFELKEKYRCLLKKYRAEVRLKKSPVIVKESPPTVFTHIHRNSFRKTLIDNKATSFVSPEGILSDNLRQIRKGLGKNQRSNQNSKEIRINKVKNIHSHRSNKIVVASVPKKQKREDKEKILSKKVTKISI